MSEWYPVQIFSRSGGDSTNRLNFVDLKEALGSDIIFLTIPIRSIPGWMEENAHLIPSSSTLVDCASVKLKVLEWVNPYAEKYGFHFVATHPLFGPDSAAGGLKNHKIVVIPQKVPYPQLRFLTELFEKKLGLQIISMSADEHDRMMAYNLSLVHLIGRTLDNLNIHHLPLKMPNLDGLLRIATVASNDSFELFVDMNHWNPYAEEVREQFLGSLNAIVERYLKKG
ncbi:MAG: prephenate dehydrogenase [Methanobacteriota archaeon]|nr:MAG: prephenate dehydrogenase [Euryarchaeota archaeon]